MNEFSYSHKPRGQLSLMQFFFFFFLEKRIGGEEGGIHEKVEFYKNVGLRLYGSAVRSGLAQTKLTGLE
jgi:hypothetical protein